MKIRAAVLCLTIVSTVGTAMPHSAVAQDEKLFLMQMTPQELAAHGLAVRELRMPPFPNSCRVAGNPRFSVSDAMLSHFRSRGFTLESLCLGLSSHIHYDPETGRQLPLAHVPQIAGRDGDIPLNLPDCFRNAVADLECNVKYDTWIKYRLKPSQLPGTFPREFDVKVRRYLQQRQSPNPFIFQSKDVGDGNSVYEWLLASPALPRGYGYAFHGPEGDDPEPEVTNSATYEKNGDADQSWDSRR
jgi:hypothetical protein